MNSLVEATVVTLHNVIHGFLHNLALVSELQAAIQHKRAKELKTPTVFC